MEVDKKIIFFCRVNYKFKLLFLSLKFLKDVNCQDLVGNTPLHTAIENDSFEAIDFLLKM